MIVNENNPQEILNRSLKSLKEFYFLIGLFYVIAILFLLIFYCSYNIYLILTLGIILGGNLIIAILTQYIHHGIYIEEIKKQKEKQEELRKINKLEEEPKEENLLINSEKHELILKCLENKIDKLEAKELFFQSYFDCKVRCFAGILEMTLYTVFFAVGLWEIIAGYLLLKALSIWEPKSGSTVKKGMSTAGLRIAVVLSLIFALWASHFLGLYLQDIGFQLKLIFPLSGFN